MDIIHTLGNMRAEDQKRFLSIRTAMRKAYLMSIQSTVGIANFTSEDDTFLDAIDIKCEMLAARAGMDTLDKDNSHPEEFAADMFFLVTRPAAKAEPPKQTVPTAGTPMPDNNWVQDAQPVAKVA